MGAFSATFSKEQRQRAKERGENLVCLSIQGQYSKQSSIEFAGPVTQEHADRVLKLMTEIMKERAEDEK